MEKPELLVVVGCLGNHLGKHFQEARHWTLGQTEHELIEISLVSIVLLNETLKA
jgi:hypothetical protein